MEGLESFIKERMTKHGIEEDFTDEFNRIRDFIKNKIDFRLLFTNESSFRKQIGNIKITKNGKPCEIKNFFNEAVTTIVEDSIKNSIPTFTPTVPATNNNPKYLEFKKAYEDYLKRTPESDPETGGGGGGED
jgi:hypothetical protein